MMSKNKLVNCSENVVKSDNIAVFEKEEPPQPPIVILLYG